MSFSVQKYFPRGELFLSDGILCFFCFLDKTGKMENFRRQQKLFLSPQDFFSIHFLFTTVCILGK